MNAPLSALVVDPDTSRRLRTVTALASAGFHVTATNAFDTARKQIVSSPPAVLLAALKLGEYNGLHLVLRAKAMSPRTATLVIAESSGLMFQRDVDQAGATFVTEPVSSQDIVAAVLRTIFRKEPPEPITRPFERRVADRRMSYQDRRPDRRTRDRRRDIETLFEVASLG